MRVLNQTLIDGQDPNANGPADYADTRSKAVAAAAVAPFARVKWAGSAQVSDANGVWTKTLPAGFMVNAPAVGIACRMDAGVFVPRIAVTGTAAVGFTITVTWIRMKDAPMAMIPAGIVGSPATNVAVSIYVAPGAVTFDIAFMEPDQVGN